MSSGSAGPASCNAPGVDQSGIVVATMTLARSAAEERLLRDSLTALSACGLPVAVSDAGSSSGFLHFIESLPRFSVTAPSTPGLVGQIAASLQLAARSEPPWILYTEPDKQFFFKERMVGFLRAASADNGTGVVLASRSADSFRTFPPMQRYTETVINTLCRELIGVDGDYSYGPFVLNRTLVPLAAGMDPRLGWGWRHHMFRMAHRQGLRVVAIAGDYPCPEDQQAEDDSERAHRLRQLSQNLLGLIE